MEKDKPIVLENNIGIQFKQSEKSLYLLLCFPAYPFVLMPSQSTGHQKYPLCLKQIFLEEPGQGYFNTFGINPAAGVENW